MAKRTNKVLVVVHLEQFLEVNEKHLSLKLGNSSDGKQDSMQYMPINESLRILLEDSTSILQ